MRNIIMEIQYDGSRYSGWQRQADALTVCGEVEKVMSLLCDKEVEVEGASRTDAGVHALCQVARLRGSFNIPTENIKRAANNILPHDIVISEVYENEEFDFHPRFAAKSKTYRYRILNSQQRNPFLSRYTWHIERKLDVEAMRTAVEYVPGTRDYRCFQAAGAQNMNNTVRTIYDLKVEERNVDGADEIHIVVDGDGFLYKMVRNITGTLVDIGIGRFEPDDMCRIIESKNRQNAGQTAPPCGLILEKIFF